MITPADERIHPADAGELWAESWYLDFARPDGVGGFLALHLYPHLGVAWWWTLLLTPRGLVAVRDHEVPLPRTGLQIRAEGLWADLVCETPLEHWGVGLEAFGVALDDPLDAWQEEWGERLPVGLDLEWELLGPPEEAAVPGPPDGAQGGFVQPGSVRGELLVGTGRIAFDALGLRARRWGSADWWSGRGGGWAGFVRSDGAATACGPLAADFGPEGLPRRATYPTDGGSGAAVVLGVAPLLVTAPGGRQSRLARALCRFDGPAAGAVGWAEWLLGPAVH